MATTKKIIVVHPVLGELALEPKHTERLLSMKNNGGWTAKQTAAKKEDHADGDIRHPGTGAKPGEKSGT